MDDPGRAVPVAWLWLLDSIFSPIDWVLRAARAARTGRTNMYWLGEPDLAMASVIAVHVWRLTPLAAVIMMAGLVAIPQDIDEAARVDGAGFWRRMFEVTIPLTLPVIAVAALFGAIFTFTDMAVVYVLTRGGPTNATQVLASWAFFRGIDGGDVGPGRGGRAVPLPAAAGRGDRHPAGGAADGGAVMRSPTADGRRTERARSAGCGAGTRVRHVAGPDRRLHRRRRGRLLCAAPFLWA